jgi:hypothetical protein
MVQFIPEYTQCLEAASMYNSRTNVKFYDVGLYNNPNGLQLFLRATIIKFNQNSFGGS